MMTLSRNNTRPGFTLVEMLVVITIIGILVAILVPTLGMAIRKTKIATMGFEVDQIAQAMEAYAKDHNNDYPPDFTSRECVEAHIRTAYPRNRFNVTLWLTTATVAPVPDPRDLDPAEAIVFWLSLTRNDPRNPITGAGEAKSYFDFDPTRLTDFDNDGWNEYVPKHASGAPYVYFDGRTVNVDVDGTAGGAVVPTCAYAFARYPSKYNATAPTMSATDPTIARVLGSIPGVVTTSATGVVRPYRSNEPAPTNDVKTWPNVASVNDTLWVNPGKFQLLCACLDNHFGPDNASGNTVIFKQFPIPNYKALGEAIDNVGNFTDGKTIEDRIP